MAKVWERYFYGKRCSSFGYVVAYPVMSLLFTLPFQLELYRNDAIQSDPLSHPAPDGIQMSWGLALVDLGGSRSPQPSCGRYGAALTYDCEPRPPWDRAHLACKAYSALEFGETAPQASLTPSELPAKPHDVDPARIERSRSLLGRWACRQA